MRSDGCAPNKSRGRVTRAEDPKQEIRAAMRAGGRFPQGQTIARCPLEHRDCEHQMTVLTRACYISRQTGLTAVRTGVREKCQIRHFGLLTPRRGRPYNPPIAEDRGDGNDAKD